MVLAPSMENDMAVPQTIKNATSLQSRNPTSGYIYPQNNQKQPPKELSVCPCS